MFIRKILVPVDFSARSVASLAYAVGLARAIGSEIELLHVLVAPSTMRVALDAYSGRPLPEPSPQDKLHARDQMAALIASVDHTGVVLHERFAIGDPGAVITCVAVEEREDLIVLGTHGRTGLGGFVVGSVAQTLMSSAPCPVLALGPAS